MTDETIVETEEDEENYHSRSKAVSQTLSVETLTELVEQHYNVSKPIEVSLISNGLNEVYLVEAAGEKSILRFSRVRSERYFPHQAGDYRFEAELLAFLKERDVPVAAPIARRDGQLFGDIDTPKGKRYYVMFDFADGEITYDVETKQGEPLGQALGQAHVAMDDFSSTATRYTFDFELMFGRPAHNASMASPDIVNPEDAKILIQYAQFLQKKGETLFPKTGPEYGLVHGDFWMRNIHFTQDNQLTLFDFDCCCYNWRAYDLACMRGTTKHPVTEVLPTDFIEGFMRGYQSVRPLSDIELEMMPDMVNARAFFGVGFWLHIKKIIDDLFPGLFKEFFYPTVEFLKERAAAEM